MEHKQRRKVKPVDRILPLINCLRGSVKCFSTLAFMPHVNIAEIQQSAVETTSSHFNSAPPQKRNALTFLQPFRKITGVQNCMCTRTPTSFRTFSPPLLTFLHQTCRTEGEQPAEVDTRLHNGNLLAWSRNIIFHVQKKGQSLTRPTFGLNS